MIFSFHLIEQHCTFLQHLCLLLYYLWELGKKYHRHTYFSWEDRVNKRNRSSPSLQLDEWKWKQKPFNLDRKKSVDIMNLGKFILWMSISHLRTMWHSNTNTSNLIGKWKENVHNSLMTDNQQIFSFFFLTPTSHQWPLHWLLDCKETFLF